MGKAAQRAPLSGPTSTALCEILCASLSSVGRSPWSGGKRLVDDFAQPNRTSAVLPVAQRGKQAATLRPGLGPERGTI